MFVIESTNAKQWRWISAVVATRDQAQAQLQRIPEAVRAQHRIVEHGAAEFPVFMIEGSGFEFGDLAFIQDKLRGTRPAGDEDVVHFNVYAFEGPFIPQHPGRDEMGGLLHWHVDDAALVAPRRPVLEAALDAIANGR